MTLIHRIITEAHQIEPQIPALLSYAPTGGRRSLVLILHGMGSHKSGNSLVPPNHFGLIEAGFAVASFDGRVHGERAVAGWIDPETNLPRGGLAALVEVVLGTTEDACHLLDTLSKHPAVDPDRIGAIGVSMGALVLQHVLVKEERIGAAVLIHGGNGWEGMANFFPETDEPTLSHLEALNPASQPAAFFPTPILCLNGAVDPYFPPALAETLLDRLRPYYGSHQLEQLVYPGVGHETVEAMRQDAIAWMKRFLLI
jgi:predicted esterase